MGLIEARRPIPNKGGLNEKERAESSMGALIDCFLVLAAHIMGQDASRSQVLWLDFWIVAQVSLLVAF